MRILLVKTSSLGDVIHNLPVASDLRRHFPQASIDWCVEESFAAIPRLHPAVDRIIPVAVRRWRKHLWQGATWREMAAFQRAIRERTYDAILDTQGLTKSALLASRAHGPLAGYAADSAREPLAARFYDRHFSVDKNLHAVLRNRLLGAAAFGYGVDNAVDYGIAAPHLALDWLSAKHGNMPYVVLLTATSRDDKLWPESHWIALGEQLAQLGLCAVLPAGNPVERERAARLVAALPNALAAPPMRIDALATLLAGARAVVGVDTGLTHLAVALQVPTVALYTATEPGLTGVYGTGFHRNLGGKGQCPTAAAVLEEIAQAMKPESV
jgi:heptosyltransferase I